MKCPECVWSRIDKTGDEVSCFCTLLDRVVADYDDVDPDCVFLEDENNERDV